MTVTEVGKRYMTVSIYPQSKYTIEKWKFSFGSENWILSKGIAQIYDPEKDITWRNWSPLSDLYTAIELEPNLLRFVHDTPPQATPSIVFQRHDSYHDQACSLIQYSKNIVQEDKGIMPE